MPPQITSFEPHARPQLLSADRAKAIKRKMRPMLGFKSFWSASVTLAGIELMHRIRKGQLKATGRLRPAQQFYSLAS
jgi:transposase-like protein